MYARASAHTGRTWPLAIFALVLTGLLIQPSQPLTATAAALPTTAPAVRQRTSASVTADALPTAQIDGVVWSQVTVGNTVFAGGSFTTVRPAGAAPGVDTVPRFNLMSYSITTGKYTSFAPALNAVVRTVTVTPDKKTLLVGGDFTMVGTATRSRFAAFSVKTGKLLKAAPAFNDRVNAITVVKNTAYVGGWFKAVGTKPRTNLAAVNVTSGEVSASWRPTADNSVNAMVPTPDKKKIVVGGSFAYLNGTKTRGMAPLSITTGKASTWKINKIVRDYAPNAAIFSLVADKTTIYGSGFASSGGNWEGTFAASPKDGAVKWLQDCHGDTYGMVPIGSIVYAVGHAHFCSNIGGFPDPAPRQYHRALAMTATAKGTVQTNTELGPHYGDFAGQPTPALYNWFPKINTGTATGQSQGAWSIVGTTSYIALAGEFTEINDVAQQGLVRFAVPGVKSNPNAEGPILTDASTAPQASADADGSVALSWLTNTDLDDRDLTYQVVRHTDAAEPDATKIGKAQEAVSLFWDRQTLTFVDTTAKPGTTYSYVIRATDPDKNSVDSPATTITTPPAAAVDPPPAEAKRPATTSKATASAEPSTSGTETEGKQ